MARRRGEWSKGEKAVYALFRALLCLPLSLPLDLAAVAGRLLGRLLWPLAARRREIALENLRLAYGETLSESEKKKIAFRSFVRLFQDALVLIATGRKPPVNGGELIRFKNLSLLRSLVEQGKGAILVSGHLSNFYVAVGYLGLLGFNPIVLMRSFVLRPAQRILNELAAGAGLLILDQGTSTLRLTRHLEKGGVTWFSLDQNVRHGVLVDFMGRPATTFPGAVRLARRLGVPVVPVFVRQTGPWNYEVVFREPLFFPQRTPTDAEVTEELGILMRILEEEIRLRPDQWLWCHRRWRHGERHVRERDENPQEDDPQKENTPQESPGAARRRAARRDTTPENTRSRP